MEQIISTIEKGDLLVASLLRKFENNLLTTVMIGITRLGDTRSWVITSVTLSAIGGLSFGLPIALSALFAALSAQVVKHCVQRYRPCTTDQYPKALVDFPDPWSFPSGHTCTVFGVATFLFLSGYASAIILFIFAFGMGSSRVYLGVHYPSDVIVGGFLGICSGWISFMLLTPFFA